MRRSRRSLLSRAAGLQIDGPDRVNAWGKLSHTGQPHLSGRIKPWPPDLDPMDQIHPFSITARFCLRNPKFFQNCNPVLPP
jgi:hypothetical protein